jgi:hypothetical protein
VRRRLQEDKAEAALLALKNGGGWSTVAKIMLRGGNSPSVGTNMQDGFALGRIAAEDVLSAEDETLQGDGHERALQETTDDLTAAQTAISTGEETTDSRGQTYTLEQALEVRKRLKMLGYIVFLIKLLILILTCICVVLAMTSWQEYAVTSQWTIRSFAWRVFGTVLLTWIPWYALLFEYDEETRPTMLNLAARLNVDLLVNFPLVMLSFMVTPALIAGAAIIMDLMPFTIVSYMIIFIAPIIAMITIWPVLSLGAHGLGNLKILYGSLLYVGYNIFASYFAYASLTSLSGFRGLGAQVAGVNPDLVRKDDGGNDRTPHFPNLKDSPVGAVVGRKPGGNFGVLPVVRAAGEGEDDAYAIASASSAGVAGGERFLSGSAFSGALDPDDPETVAKRAIEAYEDGVPFVLPGNDVEVPAERANSVTDPCSPRAFASAQTSIMRPIELTPRDGGAAIVGPAQQTMSAAGGNGMEMQLVQVMQQQQEMMAALQKQQAVQQQSVIAMLSVSGADADLEQADFDENVAVQRESSSASRASTLSKERAPGKQEVLGALAKVLGAGHSATEEPGSARGILHPISSKERSGPAVQSTVSQPGSPTHSKGKGSPVGRKGTGKGKGAASGGDSGGTGAVRTPSRRAADYYTKDTEEVTKKEEMMMPPAVPVVDTPVVEVVPAETSDTAQAGEEEEENSNNIALEGNHQMMAPDSARKPRAVGFSGDIPAESSRNPQQQQAMGKVASQVGMGKVVTDVHAMGLSNFLSRKIGQIGAAEKEKEAEKAAASQQQQQAAPAIDIANLDQLFEDNDGKSKEVANLSNEIRKAVIQGTLISHLHETMMPRLASALSVAKLLYYTGLALIFWGLYDEAGGLIDVLIQQDGVVTTFLSTITECVINKLMITLCFADLIVNCLVKLHLFNGYMSDERTLVHLTTMMGFTSQLKKEFAAGMGLPVGKKRRK